jgi:hypothetical protein
LADPWWRKNLRDNGNNGGPINPDSDGVDLNRNFDWRWTVGGSTDPTSLFYRGPFPASESEVQALVNLATRRKYVVGITYHSHGHVVVYPWEYDGQYTPDDATLTDIAQNLGTEIGEYTWTRSYGQNISSDWFYGQPGMYDFSVETALSFFPPAESIPIETQKNFKGIRYLLNRTFYSGVTGHVRDTLTLQPLEATVEVLSLPGDSIVPRTSDSIYGRFYRLLQNGNYAMRFSKPDYTPKIISNIPVTSDSLTKIEVLLAASPGVMSEGAAEYPISSFDVWPNPFRNYTNIRWLNGDRGQKCDVRIFDITGRLVKDFSEQISVVGHQSSVSWDGKDHSNRQLPSGVYFVKFQVGDHTTLEKLLLIR